MFRAVDRTNGQDVLLGFDRNEARLDPLRRRARDGQLACPICDAPVTVKAGEVKRWHFAHKSIADCPLSNESLELLDARMVFFQWLRTKYAQAKIEEMPPNQPLPRPFDAYVQADCGQRFGYWIMAHGLRNRKPMLSVRRRRAFHVHWLFLAANLKPVEFVDNGIRLTTTERDFMARSKYDDPYEVWGTLHYLDVPSRMVTTLRGLIPIEGATYAFSRRIETSLDRVLISPTNGELVHPGEHEQWTAWVQREKQRQAKQRQAKQRQAKRRKRRRRRRAEASAPAASPTPPASAEDAKPRPSEGDLQAALDAVKRQWKRDGLNPELPGWKGQVREEALRLLESWQR